MPPRLNSKRMHCEPWTRGAETGAHRARLLGTTPGGCEDVHQTNRKQTVQVQNTDCCGGIASIRVRSAGEGCADEALATFRQIESLGFEPDQISYASAIKACEKVGQWERAHRPCNGRRSSKCHHANALRALDERGKNGRASCAVARNRSSHKACGSAASLPGNLN